jgi:hypothetical protein
VSHLIHRKKHRSPKRQSRQLTPSRHIACHCLFHHLTNPARFRYHEDTPFLIGGHPTYRKSMDFDRQNMSHLHWDISSAHRDIYSSQQSLSPSLPDMSACHERKYSSREDRFPICVTMFSTWVSRETRHPDMLSRPAYTCSHTENMYSSTGYMQPGGGNMLFRAPNMLPMWTRPYTNTVYMSPSDGNMSSGLAAGASRYASTDRKEVAGDMCRAP